MGATSTISSTVATAEATAQSRLEKKFIKQHSSDHNRVSAAHQRGYDIFAHRRYKYQQGTGDNARHRQGQGDINKSPPRSGAQVGCRFQQTDIQSFQVGV